MLLYSEFYILVTVVLVVNENKSFLSLIILLLAYNKTFD